jgi:DNA invertase Pin-like site-specific DNA recombinase
MKIRNKCRGLIYLRRSGDRQETSLEKQLTWALDAVRQHDVIVDATLEDLKYIQDHHLHSYKSIRMDDAIAGDDLQRPGLIELINDSQADESCSHIFTFKRDRLGRPESPLDMMFIEDKLRCRGISIVRSDGISSPPINDNAALSENMMMLFEYSQAGKFSRDLSEQMIVTQLQLAEKGFRTGGNAPYGFIRVLVNERGEILEELPKGKRVRQAGCHVVIIPKDEEKIRIWIYILELKELGWGYKRIACHLNELGIPSPDSGCIRTDHDIPHEVSGRWTQSTVRSLCMNRVIIGLMDYGRRSEGKHYRLAKGRVRPLEDSDRN